MVTVRRHLVILLSALILGGASMHDVILAATGIEHQHSHQHTHHHHHTESEQDHSPDPIQLFDFHSLPLAFHNFDFRVDSAELSHGDGDSFLVDGAFVEQSQIVSVREPTMSRSYEPVISHHLLLCFCVQSNAPPVFA